MPKSKTRFAGLIAENLTRKNIAVKSKARAIVTVARPKHSRDLDHSINLRPSCIDAINQCLQLDHRKHIKIAWVGCGLASEALQFILRVPIRRPATICLFEINTMILDGAKETLKAAGLKNGQFHGWTVQFVAGDFGLLEMATDFTHFYSFAGANNHRVACTIIMRAMVMQARVVMPTRMWQAACVLCYSQSPKFHVQTEGGSKFTLVGVDACNMYIIFDVGAKVKARYLASRECLTGNRQPKDYEWHKGSVTAVVDQGTRLDITFDDGDIEMNVLACYVKHI